MASAAIEWQQNIDLHFLQLYPFLIFQIAIALCSLVTSTRAH